jgi:hypothetical protein
MFTNQKPSEGLALLATLDPASVSASTVTTSWIDQSMYFAVMAVIQTGVLGASATVDAKLQQATDNSGTGAKDVTGKSITQIVKASGDNKQVIINLKEADLDTEGNFRFVRLSLTVGVAASIVNALLFGAIPRFMPVSNQAATVQVI